MTQQNKVYIAPDAAMAFIDRAHPTHNQAEAYFRYFAQEHYFLYIDPISMVSLYNNLCEKIGPSLGKDFMRAMSFSDINVLYPDESDMQTAFKALTRYKSPDLTYTEALIAVLADRHGIEHICTFRKLTPLFGQTTFVLPL